MYISNLLPLSLVLLSSCLWDSVSASSPPPRSIKSIAHLSTQSLEIVPRQSSLYDKRSTSPSRSPVLLHSDSFRLTISAFDNIFHLHLRPNDHLLHPAARINYYHTTPEGESVLSHTEPLLRESVKAYWGEVVPEESTRHRMREDAAGVLPGSSRHPHLGWARIMVHHQGSPDDGIAPIFEGAFSANGVVHHIVTKDNYLRTKQALDPDVTRPLDHTDSHLVIWRDSDVMRPDEEYAAKLKNFGPDGLSMPRPRTCGHDSLPYNTDPAQNAALQRPMPAGISWYDPLMALRVPFAKRDDVAGGGTGSNFADSIGNSAACPKGQKVVYMGVAADCMYTAKYGSQANATQQILKNWNAASALYKSTFNISLGIVELQVHSQDCPSPVDQSAPWNVDCSSVTLNDRLSLFSDWRGRKGNDGAGLWHLMSGCPTGTEVGIAWLATLCVQISGGTAPQIVSGTGVSTSGRTEWQIVAHEIGHNFGAIHDCTDGCTSSTTCCPLSTGTCNANSQFIMSPVAEAGETVFSPCTIGNICSLMQGSTGGKTNTTCIVDPNPKIATISLQMCGNGIVEAGEDCDPGLGANSTCCDSATCKFRSDARCDPQSSPCCTDQCTFAPSTQVCRSSRDNLCDSAEMCPGNSSSCPADVFSPNGKSCGNGLACASGLCTSNSKQCQTVGASMNLQTSCPSRSDESCQISCQDPNQPNSCIVLQSLLIDGSPCGYGGMCYSGNCKPGTLLEKAKAWYVANLQISIPVTIVGAILVSLLIWGFVSILRGCYNRVPANRPVQRLASIEQINTAQVFGSQRNQQQTYPGNGIQRPSGSHPVGQRTNWVDASLYNGQR